MSELISTLSSTKTTNVMKITKQSGTATKYIKSANPLDHSITCTLCDNRQDFDVMSFKEAKAAVTNAGWKEGTLDTEPYCLCPECVEEHSLSKDNIDKLNEVEYE